MHTFSIWCSQCVLFSHFKCLCSHGNSFLLNESFLYVLGNSVPFLPGLPEIVLYGAHDSERGKSVLFLSGIPRDCYTLYMTQFVCWENLSFSFQASQRLLYFVHDSVCVLGNSVLFLSGIPEIVIRCTWLRTPTQEPCCTMDYQSARNSSVQAGELRLYSLLGSSGANENTWVLQILVSSFCLERDTDLLLFPFFCCFSTKVTILRSILQTMFAQYSFFNFCCQVSVFFFFFFASIYFTRMAR